MERDLYAGEFAALASTTDNNRPEYKSTAEAEDDFSQYRHQCPRNRRIIWPAHRIPVEIFNIIVEFLPRKDVQSMRLVNHEFDDKLAEIYFKAVVVPFRPEFEALYGSLNVNPTQGGDSQKLSLVLRKKEEDVTPAENPSRDRGQAMPDNDSLLSAGHRVFQQFGYKMRKFALALELNEQDLAFPPLKLNQEIVSAPWGLYRWPIMNYQRYTQLEGLEQMADETGYMKKAFQFLELVSEIGISCDAGLGWLHGPDTNPFCSRTGPAVFRPVAYGDTADGINETSDSDEKSSLSLSILKQMVLNAGFSPLEWPKVVLRLLQDEGREGAVMWADRIAPDGKLVHERVPKMEVDEYTSKEDIIQHIESVIDRDNERGVYSGTDIRSFGLVPNNLTSAQAEMLLELEWAHRALMQSYRIAVMDNKNSFKNLRQLTIARCPGCHVLTWCDDSFWETMTSIETFHLGVIPDWRKITKYPTGDVQQRRIAPTWVFPNVFKLLNEYVGEQDNIKNFSFEWVCGGEFSVGKSQRDRYILPAPVLSVANSMVNVRHTFDEDEILNIPYVRKLTLKNCWFTPHVFLNFFKHMSMESLRETNLESVSLTGPPSMTPEMSIYPGTQAKPIHWPWPLCVGAEPGHWFRLQRTDPNAGNANAGANAGNANQVMGGWIAAAMGQNAAMPNLQAPLDGANIGVPLNGPNNVGFWPPPQALGHNNHANSVVVNHVTPQVLTQNAPNPNPYRWRTWSWPHVLASLGTAAVAVGQHLQDLSEEERIHWQNTLTDERRFSNKFSKVFYDRDNKHNHQVLKFKSCGYALIESPNIDNWEIIPVQAVQVNHSLDLMTRLRELDNQMLYSQDGLLAKVLNYMPDDEMRQLRDVFGLEFGWQNLYDPIVAQVAIADGNPLPGLARFHGHVDNVD